MNAQEPKWLKFENLKRKQTALLGGTINDKRVSNKTAETTWAVNLSKPRVFVVVYLNVAAGHVDSE